MTFLKKNWCLMIIAVLLFLLVYTIYTSSIPLPTSMDLEEILKTRAY